MNTFSVRSISVYLPNSGKELYWKKEEFKGDSYTEALELDKSKLETLNEILSSSAYSERRTIFQVPDNGNCAEITIVLKLKSQDNTAITQWKTITLGHKDYSWHHRFPDLKYKVLNGDELQIAILELLSVPLE
jgi:hypothetical protein